MQGRDGWRKVWTLSLYSNRNKFRLYVRCATLWLICRVQEKHSVHSSTLVNVNSLNNLRIHLQTTYIYLSLLAWFLMPVTAQDHTARHTESCFHIACQMSYWTVCPETSQALFKRLLFFFYFFIEGVFWYCSVSLSVPLLSLPVPSLSLVASVCLVGCNKFSLYPVTQIIIRYF